MTLGEDGMPLMVVLPTEGLPFAEAIRRRASARSFFDVEIAFEEAYPALDFSDGHRSAERSAYPRY